jgi:hypothetical protein
MKVVITVIVALTVTIVASAQKSVSVKIFHNTDNVERSTSPDYFGGVMTSERVWNFRRISFAVEFGKRETFRHQLELFFPQIQRSTSVPAYPINYSTRGGSWNWESTAVAFRYEALKKLGSATDRTKFLFGIGLNPYYQKSSILSTQSTYSDRHLESFGAAINAITGVEIALTNNFGIEASIPLKIYDFRFRRQRINNPALPVNYQTNTGHEHVFFETAYTLRLGLTYKLK